MAIFLKLFLCYVFVMLFLSAKRARHPRRHILLRAAHVLLHFPSFPERGGGRAGREGRGREEEAAWACVGGREETARQGSGSSSSESRRVV